MVSILKISARDVVTPVAAITFIVTALTGIMLLLHWNTGLVRTAHEWLSLVFAGLALWHLARHRKSFAAHLKRHSAVAVMMISLLASIAFTGVTANPASVEPGAVFRSLGAASLEMAAPAFGLRRDQAVTALAKVGIDAAGYETVQQIGMRSGLEAAGVITILARTALDRS